jgi:hypothetical protein
MKELQQLQAKKIKDRCGAYLRARYLQPCAVNIQDLFRVE